MKKLGIILILCAALGGRTFAQIMPSVTVTIDGNTPVPVALVTTDRNDQGTADSWGINGSTTVGPVNSPITFSQLSLESDPSITYAFSVTNATPTTNTYVFTFIVPVSIPAGPTQVDSSLFGSIIDASPFNGVTLSPLAGSSIQQGFVGISPASSVDLGNATLSYLLPTNPHGVGFSYAGGPEVGPSGPATFIELTDTFTLTGNGDAAAFTGSFTVTPVPEPASWLLDMMGMSGLFIILQLRRQAKWSKLKVPL